MASTLWCIHLFESHFLLIGLATIAYTTGFILIEALLEMCIHLDSKCISLFIPQDLWQLKRLPLLYLTTG